MELRIGRQCCPHCGRTEIYISRSQSIWEDLMVLVLLRPVRCRSCLARFYRPLWITTPMNPVIASGVIVNGETARSIPRTGANISLDVGSSCSELRETGIGCGETYQASFHQSSPFDGPIQHSNVCSDSDPECSESLHGWEKDHLADESRLISPVVEPALPASSEIPQNLGTHLEGFPPSQSVAPAIVTADSRPIRSGGGHPWSPWYQLEVGKAPAGYQLQRVEFWDH